jgi:hypothetical protein
MSKRITHILFNGLFVVCLMQSMPSDQGEAAASYSFNSLNFSGYSWQAVSTSSAMYPGPNVFSNNSQNVWVDKNGLHLRMTYRNDVWNCAEVVLEKDLGYGFYTFYIDSSFTNLNLNAVVGLFLYRDDTHEYDIEFSRWGESSEKILQYSIQPATKEGNKRGFPVSLQGTYTTHQIKWTSDAVEFLSQHGHYQQKQGTDFLIADWQRSLRPYERTAKAQIHINLWQYRGSQPASEGSTNELVISKFLFTPLESIS